MAAQREIIRPIGTAAPRVPISPAVKVGHMVYTSGMLGVDAAGRLVEGGVEAQTRQTLENLKAALTAAGSSLDRVVKATVFMTDRANFQAMNGVWRAYFPADPPARSTVECGLMLDGALVEIELVATAG
jgi:2-iminobutanoate/2-iminopropanoate deaminase